MKHQRIVEILCRRDDITAEEAQERINETLRRMEECGYDPVECEDILAEELGLEPDYLFDLLF